MAPDPESDEIFSAYRDEETLRERARRLAQAPTPPAGPEVEAVCFRLHGEQYAVEMRLLRAVHHVRGLTPVPCTPPFIAGVLNIRGEVITVLALDVALGLTASGKEQHNLPDDARILLAEYRRAPVGVLVDEVLGMQRFSIQALEKGVAGKEYVQGIADARTVLLDLERLLSDPQFDVSDDVA